MMTIRHATIDDLPRIMEIYAGARAFMVEHGNPRQWAASGWPPECLIREDIAQQHCYVCEHEDRVVGVFYHISGTDIDPTYRTIEDGAWIGDDTYGVVHRMAGDGSAKGIGRFCLDWAYEQCGHLRVDTHGDNKVMQNLLASDGFVHCGTIYVEEDNDPRLAYERV